MLADAFKVDLLTYLFNGTAISNLGNDLFASLHESWPGRNGTQSTGETNYTGYPGTRVACARNSAAKFTIVSPGEVRLAAEITWPKQTDAGTDVLKFLGIGLQNSGATRLVACGALGGGSPKMFSTEASNVIRSEAHGLSDGEKIVPYTLPFDIAFPSELTEGTDYFVRDATTDTFKVEATIAGGAITITAGKRGRWQKIEPIQMALNRKPLIESYADNPQALILLA